MDEEQKKAFEAREKERAQADAAHDAIRMKAMVEAALPLRIMAIDTVCDVAGQIKKRMEKQGMPLGPGDIGLLTLSAMMLSGIRP